MKDPKQKRFAYLLGVVVVLGALVYLLRSFIFAAFVNGEPILRTSVISELEAQGGAQVLDNLVTKTLIMQKAREENSLPSEDEITSEIESIRTELEGQGLNLETALEQQGQTMETLRENIKVQLAIEKMVGGDIEITEEQINEYYEANAEFYGEETTIEDVSAEIEEQLRQQELSGKYQDFVSGLRNDAEIYRFVNY